MKTLALFGLPILLLISFANYSTILAQHTAMTYNIRYATERDGINSWDNRKEWVADLLNYYEPNVFGIQEGLQHQVSFLDSTLVDYNYVGVARDDGEKQGEYAAIFYQSDEFIAIDSGTFWLSLTPEKPSFGWGANYRRICTWVKLESLETKEQWLVFNAHFDHESEEARLESAKLIYDKERELNTANLPVLIMGDFNAVPNSEPIEILTSAYSDSKMATVSPPFGPIGTFNGFDTSHPLNVRIDYIFVSSNVQVNKYAVLSNSREQRTPSDHLPVYISFTLK